MSEWTDKNQLWAHIVLRMTEQAGMSGLVRELALNCEPAHLSPTRFKLLTDKAFLIQPKLIQQMELCAKKFFPLVSVSVEHGCSNQPIYPIDDALKAASLAGDAIGKAMYK